MQKEQMIETINQARQLLDSVYYAVEDSADPVRAEIARLMSWCDTCAMDATIEAEKIEA